MSHEFDSGVFYREAAWHKLGNVVGEWPESKAKAMELAGLDRWDVEPAPLAMPVFNDRDGSLSYATVNGWQAIVRNDKPQFTFDQIGDRVVPSSRLLGIQQTSYQIITNNQFLDLIEHIVGKVGDFWAYETLISLSGGRLIVCTLRAREPLSIGPDPSKSYMFLPFTSRHDGQGGLRCDPTNIRVVCRNTHRAAEMGAKRDRVGFTIKHTSTWDERIEQATQAIQLAVQDSKAWEALATKLGMRKMGGALLDRLLASTFKTDSAMTDKQVKNAENNRVKVRQILVSPTCEHIRGTLLGFVNAVDEWCDHERPAHSDETRAVRSLLRAEPIKTRAVALARAASDR